MVHDVALTCDGKIAASASRDHTICLWDISSGRRLRTIHGHTAAILCIAITADARVAVSGSADRTIGVWDLRSGKCLKTIEQDERTKLSIALSYDGRTAVSGSLEKAIRIWDLASGTCLSVLLGHVGWVRCISISPDGRTVVSGSYDQTIRIWDVIDKRCLAIYPAGAAVLAVSRVMLDGRFVCGTEDGQMHFLTLQKVAQSPPIVTAAHLFRPQIATLGADKCASVPIPLFSEGEPISGHYEDKPTTGCLWCGQRFIPPAIVLDGIHAITRNADLPSDCSPCLSLPAEAWEDPRLVSACPLCQGPLKFNPFVVDTRDHQ